MPETILPDQRSGYHSRPRADRRSTPTCRSWKRTPEHHALGRALLELRARRGLSQEQLGFAADLHRNYVGAIERGEINPTFRVLLKLTVGLRLPLSELIAVYERHRAETSTDTPLMSAAPCHGRHAPDAAPPEHERKPAALANKDV
jgi:transcriptional regulator with XRE-family HTH domain